MTFRQTNPYLGTVPLIVIAIDLFCGAGGISTGIENAKFDGKKIAQVVAAVNHDEHAIGSHSLNHKKTIHFREDITNIDILPKLVKVVNEAVAKYEALGYRVIKLLHASLECTNFSNAKGGMSRDEDSRALAEFMPMYLTALDPDYFTVENVKEFKDWGPMEVKVVREFIDGFWVESCPLIKKRDKVDKKKFTLHPWMVPIKSRKEEYYWQWANGIYAMGYQYKDKMLNAADFGEYTSRNRFFVCFARPGLPILFPKPTHAKEPAKGSGLKKWKPVKDVLNFDDEGDSIFNRPKNTKLKGQQRKDLEETTLKRYLAGLVKFVPVGEDNFIVQNNTGDPNSKVINIDRPARTVTGSGGKQNLTFISRYYTGSDEHRNHSVDEPVGVVTTENRFAKVSVDFLSVYHGSGDNVHSIHGAAPTIATNDGIAKVRANFISEQYGKSVGTSVQNPLNCITNNPKQSLMSVNWLDMQFTSGKRMASVYLPAGGMCTVPKEKLMTAKFIIPGNFNNGPADINDPSPTILASRHYHYLLNPQHLSETALSVDNPCFTLIARMDKAPPYVATATESNLKLGIVYADKPEDNDYSHLAVGEKGEICIIIYANDNPTMKAIKEFMALHGIIDIKMRMLNVDELLRIQGFPVGYKLTGSITKKKWMIGNAQPPMIPQRWVEALFQANLEQIMKEEHLAA